MEAHAVSTFRAWNDNQEAEVKRREDILTAELKVLIPKALEAWIKEDMGDWTIQSLIKTGRCSSDYSTGQKDQLIYNYTDLREFAERFEQLKTAWKGIIDIDINWDFDYRFEVTFIVI